jgi:hypothetical protein
MTPFGAIWVSYYTTYNIIVPKDGTFNFGYQFWFPDRTIIILQNELYVILFLNNNKFHYLYWKIHKYI